MGGKLIAELCHYTSNVSLHYLIMAAQWDRPLYFAAVVSIFFLLFRLFFPLLFSAVGDLMSTILPHMMCQKFIAESADERILKIAQQLASQRQKQSGVFQRTYRVYTQCVQKNTSFVFYIISSQVNELHKNFIIYS